MSKAATIIEVIGMVGYMAAFLYIVCSGGRGRASSRDRHGDYLDAGGDDCGGSDSADCSSD